MIQVEASADELAQLEVLSLEKAYARIETANGERQREAEEANEDGDMDDFRHLSPKWTILDCQLGKFVATIDYCGSRGISYGMHFRVEGTDV
jgi:hypothetical protein